MINPVFRIARAGRFWSWQRLDSSGAIAEEGLSSSRAEAAAFIIRGVIRAELPKLAIAGELNTDLAA